MNVIKRFSDYMALIGAEVVAPDWNPLEWKVETKYGPLRISLHATDFTKQCKPRSKYNNLVSIYCAFQNKQCEPFLQKEYNQRRVTSYKYNFHMSGGEDATETWNVNFERFKNKLKSIL